MSPSHLPEEWPQKSGSASSYAGSFAVHVDAADLVVRLLDDRDLPRCLQHFHREHAHHHRGHAVGHAAGVVRVERLARGFRVRQLFSMRFPLRLVFAPSAAAAGSARPAETPAAASRRSRDNDSTSPSSPCADSASPPALPAAAASLAVASAADAGGICRVSTAHAIAPKRAGQVGSSLVSVSSSIDRSSPLTRRSLDVRLARRAAVAELAAIGQRDLLQQAAGLAGAQGRDDHGDRRRQASPC